LDFCGSRFIRIIRKALKMPDYTGIAYDAALKDAKKHKFRMSIQDSMHILGRPGGEIIKQNPDPGSLFKQNRMIYVTITKRSPDKNPFRTIARNVWQEL
jgi:beta-lactam-binding protein with PASTA domain